MSCLSPAAFLLCNISFLLSPLLVVSLDNNLFLVRCTVLQQRHSTQIHWLPNAAPSFSVSFHVLSLSWRAFNMQCLLPTVPPDYRVSCTLFSFWFILQSWNNDKASFSVSPWLVSLCCALFMQCLFLAVSLSCCVSHILYPLWHTYSTATMHVPSTLLLPNVVSLFSVSFHDLSPSRCVFYYVVYFPPVSHSTCLSPAAFSSCNDSFLISYCPSFCVSFSCRVSCTAFPIWSTLQYCNNSTTLQTHFLPNGLEKNFLMKPLSVSSWPVSYLSPCVSPLDNGSTQLVCVEGGGNWSWHPPPHSHLPPPAI